MQLKPVALTLLSASIFLASCAQGGGGASSTASATLAPSVSPAPGETNVSLNSEVRVGFTVPIQSTTVTPATFTLFTANQQIASSVRVVGNEIFLTPTNRLLPDTIYRATVTQRVRTTTGKTLDQDLVWSFRTSNPPGPVVVQTLPIHQQMNVEPTTVIEAVFDQDLDPFSINSNTFFVKLDGNPNNCPTSGDVNGRLTVDSRRIRFVPDSPLVSNQSGAPPHSYTVTVSSSITNLEGISVVTNFCWQFTTGDRTAPAVTLTNPVHQATGVGLTAQQVTAVFDEAIVPGSVNANSITIREVAGPQLAGTTSIGSLNNDIRFDFAAPTTQIGLMPNTFYSGRVAAGITDAIGNASTEYNWTFQTRQGFSLPQNMEADTANTASTPRIRFDPTRNLYQAVWLQNRNGTLGVFASPLAIVPDTAAVFAVETDHATACTDPKIEVSPVDGTIHYFWIQNSSLWTARKTAGGVSAAEAIDADGSASGQALTTSSRYSTAISSTGVVFVAFDQADGTGTTSVYVNRYEGGTWRTPEAVDNDQAMSSTDQHQAIQPKIAVDSAGTAYLVFEQFAQTPNARTGIFVNRRVANGSWSTPTPPAQLPRIDAGANPGILIAGSAQVAPAADGSVYVAYLHRGNTGNPNAPEKPYLTRRSPGDTGTWSVPISVAMNPTNTLLTAKTIQLAVVPNGNQHYVYTFFHQIPAAESDPYSTLSNRASLDANGVIVLEGAQVIDRDGLATTNALGVNNVIIPAPAVLSDGRVVVTFLQRETSVGTDHYRLMSNQRQLNGSWGAGASVLRVDSPSLDTTIYDGASANNFPYAIIPSSTSVEARVVWQQADNSAGTVSTIVSAITR